MARRKLRTEVVRTVTLEFTYNPLTDRVPNEGDVRAWLTEACTDFATNGAFDGEDAGSAPLARGRITTANTTMRRVPVAPTEQHPSTS